MNTEAKNYFYDLNDKVFNGELSPLKAYIELKGFEKLIAELIKGTQEDAINEAETYGKGEHQAHGAKFTIKSGPSTWDFSGCANIIKLKKELKDQEDKLKKLAEGGLSEIMDVQTGEVLDLPIKKQGRTTISIKL